MFILIQTIVIRLNLTYLIDAWFVMDIHMEVYYVHIYMELRKDSSNWIQKTIKDY